MNSVTCQLLLVLNLLLGAQHALSQQRELPQNLLERKLPEKALQLMKSFPEMINEKDDDSRTPLHVAARFGQVEIVEWLLENNADSNAEAYNRFTPLYLAHLSSNPQIYKLLLEADADPHLETAFGDTPLQMVVSKLYESKNSEDAAQTERWERILAVFIDHGVAIDLVLAIQLGNDDLVKEMLQADPQALEEFVLMQEPLRAAVKFGRYEITEYLLENFPDQTDVDNFSGGEGYPVAMEGLRHADLLRLLIDHGADLERPIAREGPWGGTGGPHIGDQATLLHFAAREGSPDVIKLLLDNGLDPFARAGHGPGQTVLEIGSRYVGAEILLPVLNHPSFQKGDPAIKSRHISKILARVKASPTRYVSVLKACLANVASMELKKNILSVLLNEKVDPTTLIQLVTQNIDNNAPLYELKDMVQSLQAAGGKLDLFSAIAIQDTETVNSMLDTDARLCEARRADGYPAVHYAIRRGEMETVEKLLEAGCNLELKNHSKSCGYFAGRMLHEAALWSRARIAHRLIEKGADVNAIAKQKITPLHIAARVGNTELVRLLLANGAELDAEDLQGRTPLDYVTDASAKELLRELTPGNDR